MFKKVKTLVAATVAVGMMATAASALVVTEGGYTYEPDNVPNNLEAAHLFVDGASATGYTGLWNILSVGSMLAGDLDKNSTETRRGWINFNFRATEKLGAVNLSTNNPDNGFLGIRLAWCNTMGIDFSTGACSDGEESFVESPVGGKALSTVFEANQEKTLVATWTGGTENRLGNLDFFVETSPVPLPAAGFLLLGALGGLGLARRRKKAA